MTSARGIMLVGSSVIRNQKIPKDMGRSFCFADVRIAMVNNTARKITPVKKRASPRDLNGNRSVSALSQTGRKNDKKYFKMT